jgi:hypothetical protein
MYSTTYGIDQLATFLFKKIDESPTYIPCIIDFMNTVRRCKTNTLSDELNNAFYKISNRVDKRFAKTGRIGVPLKIFVHKNPEGVIINPKDPEQMVEFTKNDTNSIILYAVWRGAVKQGSESFTEMKRRIRLNDSNSHAMYGRDDAVINVIHSLISEVVCTPYIYSYDTYRDDCKYGDIGPFNLYLFSRGKTYKFLFSKERDMNSIVRQCTNYAEKIKRNSLHSSGCNIDVLCPNVNCKESICSLCGLCSYCKYGINEMKTCRLPV